MLFNSVQFVVFAAFTGAVFKLTAPRFRWLVLLCASYVFYCVLSVKAAAILFGVSLISYASGRTIHRAHDNQRGVILGVSVAALAGILLYFKYTDFIISNLNALRADDFELIHVLLPVGISFYIFQALSYLIDVYLGKTVAERHVGHFLLYLSFFPKLLQGPIERANDLMPQIKTHIRVPREKITQGTTLLLYGLVKKVVIADRLALYSNQVFSDVTQYYGLPLLAAVYVFTFQIYFDFAGYTDMARGLGKLFGIELSENFAGPYLSKNVQEFWRRWHMTFSFWLRDYLFVPLMAQFRNLGTPGVIAAALVTFFICGLWHGPSWGYVTFGLLHGIYIAGSILTLKERDKFYKRNGISPLLVDKWRVFVTFQLIAFSFIFFRASTMGDAFYIIQNMFSAPNLSVLTGAYSIIEWLILACALALILNRPDRVMAKEQVLTPCWGKKFYFGLLANFIIFFSVKSYAPFIYFKF